MYKHFDSLCPLALLLWALVSGSQALADDPAPDSAPAPATVVHYTDTAARQVPSGKAVVFPIASQEQGAQNAFFAVLQLEAGAQVPLHRDATEEYIYIIEGTGTITIDGLSHEVGPGHGVFMPALAEVSFVAKGAVRAVQVFAGPGPEAKYDTWQSVD
jgi:quercetin dioxygenase-like cupin family protein